jgi:regulator of protease activity HflC (stomatin/prohibitin superfamily)
MFAKLIVVFVITGVLIASGQAAYAVPFFIIAFGIVLAIESIKVVPQQQAWVVERFGKFNCVLEPGLSGIWPFFDRVAYKHSLKEVPLDVSEQVCITKDNTQLDHLLSGDRSAARVVRFVELHCGDHAACADDAALRDRQDGTR